MTSTKAEAPPVVAAPQPEAVTTIERIVLSCATPQDDLKVLKKDLKPGQYQGKMAVLIDYLLTKAEPTDSVPDVVILTPEILARALIDAKVSIPVFLASLKKAAIASLTEARMSKELTEQVTTVTGAIAIIKDNLQSKMKKVPRSGATKAKLRVARLAVPVFPGEPSWMGAGE